MKIISDRFEIERLVGVGGMGEVYKARDRITGGDVAVKLLHAAQVWPASSTRRGPPPAPAWSWAPRRSSRPPRRGGWA